jgi:hypothetical protein
MYSLHHLPLWFLVLSLFVPRIALLLGWLEHWRFPVIPLAGLALWIFLPRVLVLFMIYLGQGISLWFIVHLLVALGVFSYGGHRTVYRRYSDRRIER